MLTLFKRLPKVLYNNLGTINIYVNPEEEVALKLRHVGSTIYVIPYDEFQWNDGYWYIEPETRVDLDFIKQALVSKGFKFKSFNDKEKFSNILKLSWLEGI